MGSGTDNKVLPHRFCKRNKSSKKELSNGQKCVKLEKAASCSLKGHKQRLRTTQLGCPGVENQASRPFHP